MSKQWKVILVIGTRPEAIKMIPVYKAFRKYPDIDVQLLSTGQHKEMLLQIFSFFGVEPDVDLSLMTKNQSLPELTALILKELSFVLNENKPDLVMVQGDTTTAMITSLASYYLKISVAHVEAGLRTYDKYAPFPEEINRKMISAIADYHFAPTKKAALALEKENVKGRIEIVGNTVIDSLYEGLNLIKNNIQSYEHEFAQIINAQSKVILVTMHRRESFGLGLQNICNAICQLSKLYPEFTFVYPVHLNPNVREVVEEVLSGKENIKLIEPLPYGSLIYLMSISFLILTDSGGIQEEAPSLNVPVIILRDTTERQEAVDAGCAVLGTTKQHEIIGRFKEIVESKEMYNKMQESPNPFGDGNASARIAKFFHQSFLTSSNHLHLSKSHNMPNLKN